MAMRMTKEQLKLHGMDTRKAEYKDRQEWDNTYAIEAYPSAPTKFREKTRQAWKKAVAQLVNMRTITTADLVALELMFDTYDRYWSAITELEKHNKVPLLKRDKLWYSERNHLEKIIDHQKDRFWQECLEFGLTPKSRRSVLGLVDEKKAKSLKEKLGVSEWTGSLSI